MESELEIGWSANVFGKLAYIAPDQYYEDADWTEKEYTDDAQNSFLRSISKTEKFVLSMMIEGETGGDCHFEPDKILLNLAINRKYISEYSRFVDVTWYLKKLGQLIPYLPISNIECRINFCG